MQPVNFYFKKRKYLLCDKNLPYKIDILHFNPPIDSETNVCFGVTAVSLNVGLTMCWVNETELFKEISFYCNEKTLDEVKNEYEKKIKKIEDGIERLFRD